MTVRMWIFAATILLAAPAHAGAVLDRVKAQQHVNCGVVTDQDDYSKDDTHGNLAALGADLCRAVTAAVLGADGKVIVSAYPDEPSGLKALKDGKIDVLGAATPSLQNRAHYPVAFGPPVLLDGQGFLVNKSAQINSLSDLSGKQICFLGGTEADENLMPALTARGVRYIPFPFEETGEMEAALVSGHCTAITADVSQLANMRAAFLGRKYDYEILPETITDDPAAPAYPDDDRQWAQIVDWTVNALIQAEARGVTAANVESMKASDDLVVRRLLGVARGPALALGLDQWWSVRAIAATGNYGEIFDRDVGARSPLRLARGPSALWTEGGRIAPMPIR